jgi:hypothetical protein
MKLILEFDDFHWRYPENCISEIQELVDEFPDIKISLFTTALLSNLPISNNVEWVSKVKKFILSDNIRLAVHGIYHNNQEFKYMTKDQALASLSLVHSAFDHAKLPFVKVFRGPHWGINQESIDALNELSYTHLYNHEDYRNLDHLFKNKVVYYNWNLKDDSPVEDTLVAHGHTHNVCENGIKQVMPKIKKFIIENNPTFGFVDEI